MKIAFIAAAVPIICMCLYVLPLLCGPVAMLIVYLCITDTRREALETIEQRVDKKIYEHNQWVMSLKAYSEKND